MSKNHGFGMILMIWCFLCFGSLCEARRIKVAQPKFVTDPGLWQEPGLWRSTWVVDRSILNDDPDRTTLMERCFGPKWRPKYIKDRIHIKLRPDHTVLICQKHRPLLSFRPRPVESADTRQARRDSDGTWSWQLGAVAPHHSVRMEIRQPTSRWARSSGNPSVGVRGEQVSHEATVTLGSLDDYSAHFGPGALFKYRGRSSGLPIGRYPAGSFVMRCNPGRPLLSKDFQGIQ